MNLNKNHSPLFNLNNSIILVVSVLLSVSFLFYFSSQTSIKICVVDNQKLFEQFRMTNEIKVKGEQLLKSQKIKIDSLNVQLALEQNELIKSQIYNQILSQNEQIHFFNENYTNEESAKIWTRIEGYMLDFAKTKDCDLIIGTQKLGDVWYTQSKNDITEEAINYINKKYEGFN